MSSPLRDGRTDLPDLRGDVLLGGFLLLLREAPSQTAELVVKGLVSPWVFLAGNSKC